LRIGPDADVRNVATQSHEPGSLLRTYRRILAVRRSTRSLQDGAMSLTRTGDPTVLGYRRHGPGGEALILVSFGPGAGAAHVPRPGGGTRWRPIAGTHLDLPEPCRGGSTVCLRPYEGIIAVAEGA
jgi:glycosidase